MLIRQINEIAGKQKDGFSGASFETEQGNLVVRCWMNPEQIFPPDLSPLVAAIKYTPQQPSGEFAILDTDHSSTEEVPPELFIPGIKVLSRNEKNRIASNKFFV